MSNLSIAEYRTLGRDRSGHPLPAGEEENVTIQNLTFTTSSVQSSAFNSETKLVRIVADADSRVLFGTNPTAIASGGSASIFLPAGSVEYFGVLPNMMLAAIEAA